MASTSILRPVGQTLALSVTGSSHAAVTMTCTCGDQVNFAACLNAGAVAVAVRFTGNNVAGIAATFPSDGTPGDFVLPPAMQLPIVISIPAGVVQVTAIGISAGPSLVYITPVGDQS